MAVRIPADEAGSDADAIHDNVAAEISAVAVKVTPVNADLLLIEDSTAAFVKKHVTIGSLPVAPPVAIWTVATETTASRTAADGEFILVDAATCIVTLPSPVADARVAVKVIVGTVTAIEVRTSGAGVDIDGTDYSTTGLTLTTQYEQITLISDGTDWFIY